MRRMYLTFQALLNQGAFRTNGLCLIVFSPNTNHMPVLILRDGALLHCSVGRCRV